MEAFTKVIRERRSIRRYLPDPVPEAVIGEILDEARWAPSWGNTQSTIVYVLSAAALDRFKAALAERAANGVPAQPDLEMPAKWPEPFGGRMKSHLQGERAFIAEEEKRRGIARTGPALPPAGPSAALFGAPHLLLVATGQEVSKFYATYDAGLFTENLVLSAQARGLGTCILASAVRHPDLLRALVPESADKIFIAGIALGYPDLDAVANQFPRQRVPLDERVRFIAE